MTRRQFKPISGSVATESFTNPHLSICLEEELLCESTAMQNATEIETELNQAARSEDVADALEDLAVIADDIESLTPVEAALIDTTASMAVAGTVSEPEEIAPALESFHGKKIATESFRETARTIWENIRKFVANIWEKIKSFFYNILAAYPRMRRTIEAMRNEIKELKKNADAKPKHISVDITRNASSLTMGRNAPTDGATLKKFLSVMSGAVDYVQNEYSKYVVIKGKILVAAIDEFDPVKPEEAVRQANTKLAAAKFPAIPGQRSKRVTGRYATEVGEILPGNVSFFSRRFESSTVDKKTPLTDLETLQALRNEGVSLSVIPTITSGINPSTSGNPAFKVMTFAEAEAVLKEAEDLVNSLEKYAESATYKTQMEITDQLSRASDKATANIGKLVDSSMSSNTVGYIAAAHYRALIQTNTAFTRWVNSPSLALTQKAIATIRAALDLTGKSIKAYA